MADDAGGPTRTLDIHGIYRLLPHRPPFLMVDRIKDIDGDNFAIGIKNVTANEPYFRRALSRRCRSCPGCS